MKPGISQSKIETKWLGMLGHVPASNGKGMVWRLQWARIAVLAGGTLVTCYAISVAGGYLWLTQVRGIHQVKALDVALGNVAGIKRSIAANHLENARKSLAEKNLQAAYLSYVSALRGDGDNSAVRIEVSEFLVRVGAGKQALSVLEEGAKNSPRDTGLVERLCELLRAQGRMARVGELLNGPLKPALETNRRTVLTVWLAESTLEVGGPEKALEVLNRDPEVLRAPRGVETKALALWLTGKKDDAVKLLREGWGRADASYTVATRLYEFLEAQGLPLDAATVATEAVKRFPKVPEVRLLLVTANRPYRTPASQLWAETVNTYLRDFGAKGENVVMLADICGRRGWADLTETLYAGGIRYGAAIRVVALAHADALLRSGRLAEAGQVLADLEPQLSNDAAASIALRRRQIAVAATTGSTVMMREYARSLASLLARDPERLDTTRRQLEAAGYVEAAAEMTKKTDAKPGAGKPAAPKS